MTTRLFLIVSALILLLPSAHAGRRGEPVFAEAPYDGDLITHIVRLDPGIDPEEARQVAFVAYTTGRELKKEWQVVYPPGYQNFLIHQGKRKGGFCYQFASELLVRLARLNLKTIQLHWAESYIHTMSEHNVIVVTGVGQPFAQGILLDNWRYGGRLVWGFASKDHQYRWIENPGELARRWPRPAATKPTGVATSARTIPAEKTAEQSD